MATKIQFRMYQPNTGPRKQKFARVPDETREIVVQAQLENATFTEPETSALAPTLPNIDDTAEQHPLTLQAPDEARNLALAQPPTPPESRVEKCPSILTDEEQSHTAEAGNLDPQCNIGPIACEGPDQHCSNALGATTLTRIACSSPPFFGSQCEGYGVLPNGSSECEHHTSHHTNDRPPETYVLPLDLGTELEHSFDDEHCDLADDPGTPEAPRQPTASPAQEGLTEVGDPSQEIIFITDDGDSDEEVCTSNHDSDDHQGPDGGEGHSVPSATPPTPQRNKRAAPELEETESLSRKRAARTFQPRVSLPDDPCFDQDLPELFKNLDSMTNHKRAKLAIVIMDGFLGHAQQGFTPILHLDRCTRVEILIHLLAGLGDLDELSADGETLPDWFCSGLLGGRSPMEVLIARTDRYARLESRRQ